VHPKHREKMQVCGAGGNAREAVTFYEVLERFPGFTSVRLRPKTGRTHQLRVHLQLLGHPIVADRLYGGGATFETGDITARRPRAGPDLSEDAHAPTTAATLIARQALHALRIEFRHPVSNESMALEAPLPADMERTLEALRSGTP
jgi:23S rRNA pseudouridine1911/1915/1917 synthase